MKIKLNLGSKCFSYRSWLSLIRANWGVLCWGRWKGKGGSVGRGLRGECWRIGRMELK